MKLLFNPGIVLKMAALFFIFKITIATDAATSVDATTASTTLATVTSELEFTRQDLADLKEVVQELQRLVKLQFTNLSRPTTTPTPPPSSDGGGATYVRWGKTFCPPGSEMMYSGHVAGGYHSHKGAATNHLCVPQEPEFANFTTGLQNDMALLYGTEYYSPNRIPNFFNHGQNVPCAVCRSHARSSVVMVPAKTSCFPGWNVEYYGYLMAGHYDHPSESEYICVDHQPENVVGGESAESPHLLYFVECQCSLSLPCPPFKAGNELTCAVCTK